MSKYHIETINGVVVIGSETDDYNEAVEYLNNVDNADNYKIITTLKTINTHE